MTGNTITAGKILAAALLACACCRGTSAASESVYKKMANDITRYSGTNKIKNIAVLGFSRKARTSREESEYVSEKLLTCLAESGKVNLLERGQLDKVLQEKKLGLSGLTDGEEAGEGRIPPTDAIIIGVVFGTRDQLKIIAKMVDSHTGSVLLIIEGETERQWDMVSERPEFEFEVPDPAALAVMFGEHPQPLSFDEFRDSPVSASGGDCAGRRAALAELQSSALEAKAKHLVLRMRDPGFSAESLTRNPGGEISDPRIKQRFYELVDLLHRSVEPPRLSAGELASVNMVSAQEKKISDECGLR
jgi:hypothetical protein